MSGNTAAATGLCVIGGGSGSRRPQPRTMSLRRSMFSTLSCKCRIFLPVLFPAALAVFAYVNSLDGDFVHDDIVAVLRNPDVTSGLFGRRSGGSVFLNDFWGEPMASNTSHKSYRPVTTLLFRYVQNVSQPINLR